MPSILATRADYVDDDCLKEQLFQAAYDLATAARDRMNCMLVAHSLAEFYIEKLIDVDEGKRWLHRLDGHLFGGDEDDSWFSSEAKTLRVKVEELALNGSAQGE